VSVPLALKVRAEKKKDASFSKGKDVNMEMPQYAAPPPPAAVV
jgi:hypothetical protein